MSNGWWEKMSDDDFLNLTDSTPMEEKKGEDTPMPSPSNQNVMERTMHTITQFRIYPNGQIFIVKSQSWMDKVGTIVKKKEKAKPIKVQQSHLQKEESY